MAGTPQKQDHTEDQLKQVVLLQEAFLRDFESQDKQYTDLSTKITFLFGFVVAVLTLYGTYATNVNVGYKDVALISFGITFICLCFAYCNREFKKPARLDASVSSSNYFSKLYKDVANIKKACMDNDAPLTEMAKYVRFSIYFFTAGMVFIALSFML